MKEFAKQTIPGAAFDSSERDPPPRCHPGTRLAIVERTLRFFTDRESNKRFLWIVGPAGVGKSAIMQTLAEISPTPDFILGASLFFSVNGRDNGLKAIVTLAYQLAVKSKLYKDFVQNELANDPTLLDKALAPQFNKFIIEPFAVQGISPDGHHERFFILIDGLDECNSHDAQRTILDLISSFCIEYPTAPLVWVVASRPEPHIARFLSLPNVTPSYILEQIKVDTDESREDVERYLRNGLENVRTRYPALDHFPRWPAEHDFMKLATAAGGLFAFGKAVVDYVDDPMYANPASQLDEVLEVIGVIRSREGEGGEKKHPMADLDALYSRVVSKIPRGVLDDTKKLLLSMISPLSNVALVLPSYCNWLGIPIAAAYGALHHLHSVLDIPSVSDARPKPLNFRHKSFRDYLTDFARSGLFPNVDDEAHETHIRCATRILGGVSKARENGPDPCDGTLHPWKPRIKRGMEYQYVMAVRLVIAKLRDPRPRYLPSVLSAVRFIDIQFLCRLMFGAWASHLAFAIFGEGPRSQLEKLNAFQKVPIGMFDKGKISDWMDIIISHRYEPCDLVPTYPACALGVSHGVLAGDLGIPYVRNRWMNSCALRSDCDCAADFLQKLENRKAHSPGDILTTFTDSTGNRGWIHHIFPDWEHPLSTWEFIIPYEFKPVVALVEPI